MTEAVARGLKNKASKKVQFHLRDDYTKLQSIQVFSFNNIRTITVLVSMYNQTVTSHGPAWELSRIFPINASLIITL